MFPTFDLLGKTIPTYALMSLIGIFVSGIYICKKAKQKGYDENNFIIILIILITLVILTIISKILANRIQKDDVIEGWIFYMNTKGIGQNVAKCYYV